MLTTKRGRASTALAVLATILAIAALATPTQLSAQTPALSEGSRVLGGSANLTFNDLGDDGYLSYAVLPSVSYFVRDGLAMGGQIGFSGIRDENSSGFSLRVGPILSYYFVQEGRLHPFVSGSLAYVHSWNRFSFDGSSDTSRNSALGLTGEAGILYMITDAVGLDAHLFLSRSSTNPETGPEVSSLDGGLRLGFSAFVH